MIEYILKVNYETFLRLIHHFNVNPHFSHKYTRLGDSTLTTSTVFFNSQLNNLSYVTLKSINE